MKKEHDLMEVSQSLSWIAKSFLLVIRFYQRWISPLTPPSCRYVPTCSEYAKTAILEHGGSLGGWLAYQRICRCHPFHPGGYDPVP